MRAITVCFALSLICLPVSAMHNVVSAADPGDDGVKTFEMLKTAYKAQQDEYYAQVEKVKLDERMHLFERIHPDNTMPPEFFQLEKAHRGTRVGISCLHHLVSRAGGSPISNHPVSVSKRKALVILHKHYADHADLDLIFFWINVGARYVEANKMLRRASESPHRRVHGAALFSLAQTLAEEIRYLELNDTRLELLSRDPQSTKELAAHMKRRSFWSDVNPVESRREALQVIEQVVSTYSDVLQPPRTGYGPMLLEVKRGKRDERTLRDRLPLGTLAKRLKYEITHLHIGGQAPDINRPDAFGKPLRLRDQRGKVVVLMFSFKGCGPCEGMYPGNRAMITAMKSRPFAFLGVMGDETIDTVNQAVESKTITWPVWWEGPQRSISGVWNVKGWPGIFVLDHEGVIRYKALHGDLLNRAVNKLVAAAERANQDATPL